MFPDKDPFEDINTASITMIQGIIDQGITDKIFRPVDSPQVDQGIFMIYKIFIIQTYIKGKAPHIKQMLAETVTLMTQGLFLPADKS